jgi:large subunit ribosomal protein L22
MAPRKARLVADLIRGLPVNAALRALDRSDKRAASLLGKVVRSAVANAEQDGNVDPNHLVVSEARVDEGPLLGGFVRWKAGSRGRAMPIRKRTSHMYIALQPAGALARAAGGQAAPATDAPPSAEAPGKPARKAPAKPKAKTEAKGRGAARKADAGPAKKTTKKKKDG